MLRKLFVFLVLTITAIAVYFGIVPPQDKQPTVRDGILDLSDWDEQESLKSLDGEWQFYWGRLLTENDFRSDSRPQADRLANVPEVWSGYRISGAPIGESGFATYRLTIRVKQAGNRLALQILPISSAYHLYIDGELLVSRGVPATGADSFREDMRPATIDFVTPATQFDLIVQVANYAYPKAGINRSIYLGSPENILQWNNRMIYKDLFVLGSLVIAWFYSLSMFLMNRRQAIGLYFSCVCLIFIGRIAINGSYFIFTVFPHVSEDILTYINYFTSHWGSLVFALTARELFPDHFSMRMSRVLVAVTAVVLVLITVLPAPIYSRHYVISDILCLFVLGYAYFATAKAVLAGRPFALMAFIADSVCLLFVIIDIVYAATNHYSSSGEFSTLGFFAFIILYAFILARRFSLSFREVKVLSDRLLTLDKLKDEFLANTSHELRTPLHGIINIAESLLGGVEGGLNSGQEKNIGLIAASGRKLAHLINDILDASRLKHQDIVLNRTNVHLAPSVESVAMVLRQLYPNKKLTLTCEIPESLPAVCVDENRLVQILYNLIGNAMKFTDSGEVKVTAETAGDFVAISVADTGIGIPPDKMETIFQPFEQADSSITREYGGAGLGLSITKQLVELHGGRIAVVSIPGQGSRFTVELLVGDPDMETEAVEAGSIPDYEIAAAVQPESGSGRKSPAQAQETREANRRGERILVVDDDEVSLQSSVNLLSLEGYNVTAVTSGGAALERIHADSEYDLVILDVMMPRMSGYEVCRTIRETKPLADLPVLMATARHQPHELVLGYESGANDFLVKPFEPTEFRARVKTLIEWKHSMNRALQSEIAFLQAQIKPHFVYNTLNTISYFCARDGEKAKELLNFFAAYLRNTFDFRDMDKLVLLEKELNVVTAYLEIEKARFGDRLQVQTDVDSAALHELVPPFILQPLVENAVRHGIQKKVDGGNVSISVKMNGMDIQVAIRDTGAGMTAEQVNRLMSDGGSSRVGLRNIQLRLEKMYGKTVGITSELNQGTEVSFTITARREITI